MAKNLRKRIGKPSGFHGANGDLLIRKAVDITAECKGAKKIIILYFDEMWAVEKDGFTDQILSPQCNAKALAALTIELGVDIYQLAQKHQPRGWKI